MLKCRAAGVTGCDVPVQVCGGWVMPACQLTASHASWQHLYNVVVTLSLYCQHPPPSFLPSFLPLWQVSMKLMVCLLQPALHHSAAPWAYRRGLGRGGPVVCFPCRVSVSQPVSAAIFLNVPSEWCVAWQSKINALLLVTMPLPHPRLHITSFSTAGNDNAITDKRPTSHFFSLRVSSPKLWRHILSRTLSIARQKRSAKSLTTFNANVVIITPFCNICARLLQCN